MDDFDPEWTPNTTDAGGRRYRFGNQPYIAHWNLWQLANAIHPVVREEAPLERALAAYADIHDAEYRRMMQAKLGLAQWRTGEGDDDGALARLLRLLAAGEVDMTIFFRRLADVNPAAPSLLPFDEAFYDPARRAAVEAELLAWLRDYGARVLADGLPAAERRALMLGANPLYVPRNYLAQQAIDAAEKGDSSELETLLEVLRRPYDEQPGRARFAARRPDWARHRPGCSMLSCSS